MWSKVVGLLLVFIVYANAQTNTCIYQNPTNKLWYNLAPMTVPAGGKDFESQDTFGNTYYLNFCAAATQGGCTPPNGVCSTDVTNTPHGLGAAFPYAFYSYYPTAQTNGVTIVYQGGEYCNLSRKGKLSYLNVQCNATMPGRGTIVSAGEDPAYKCAYKFDFISQYGCGFATMQEALDYIGIPEEEAGSSGVDVGWIIIFITTVLLFVYVVIGVVVKKKKYEANGMELIPNHDFWVRAPHYCKDGFAFFTNKLSCGKLCTTYEYQQL